MNKQSKQVLQEVLDNLNTLQMIFQHINTNKLGYKNSIVGVKNAISGIEDAGINVYLSLLKKENPENIEFTIQKRSDVISILKENGLYEKIKFDDENEKISFNLNYEEATKIRSTILRRCNIDKGDLVVNYLIENNGVLNKLEINKVNGTAAEFQKNILEVEKQYLLDRGFKKEEPSNKEITVLDCLDSAALLFDTLNRLKELLNKQNMSVLFKLEQASRTLESSLINLHEIVINLSNEKNISLNIENRIDVKRSLNKLEEAFEIQYVKELPKEKGKSTVFVIETAESLEIICDRKQAVRIRSHLQNSCNLSNVDIKSNYILENEDSNYKIKLKKDIKSGADFERNILDVQKIIMFSYGKIVSNNLDTLDIDVEVSNKIINQKESKQLNRSGIKMV